MKIAVMTAYNPRNAGMYSVDMAAQKFFRSTDHDYTLFRALHGRRGPFFMNGGRLHRITDPNILKKYDAVVYWGDFLNNPLYAVEDFHIRESYYASGPHDVSASIDRWMRFFLLSDTQKGAQKIVSVSNNFQSAGRILSTLDPATASSISGALGRFDAIFPRDPASTREVRSVVDASSAAQIETGVDAAVLNRQSGYRRADAKRETFTWFFHRSGLSTEDETRLITAVAKATNLRPVNLRRWLSLNYLTWDLQFRHMVREMANSAFCISDTYHCLINAMVKDCPVIGVGRAAQIQQGTLGDFKKRELFSMFNLDDWYVEVEQAAISDASVERVVALAERASGDTRPAGLYDVLDEKAGAYRGRLNAVLG